MVADASNVGIDRQRRFNNMANDTAVTPGAALSSEIMAENMKEVGVLGVLYFGFGIWGGFFWLPGICFWGVCLCVCWFLFSLHGSNNKYLQRKIRIIAQG